MLILSLLRRDAKQRRAYPNVRLLRPNGRLSEHQFLVEEVSDCNSNGKFPSLPRFPTLEPILAHYRFSFASHLSTAPSASTSIAPFPAGWAGPFSSIWLHLSSYSPISTSTLIHRRKWAVLFVAVNDFLTQIIAGLLAKEISIQRNWNQWVWNYRNETCFVHENQRRLNNS